MVKQLLGWIFTLLFAAIGVAALGGAWMLRQHQRAVAAERVHVKGTIVRLQERRGSRGGTSYAPVVRFRTTDGRDVEVVSSVGGMKILWRIGKEVDVMYDAHDPQSADVDSWMTQWMPSVILAVIGFAFLYAALKPAPKRSEPGLPLQNG